MSADLRRRLERAERELRADVDLARLMSELVDLLGSYIDRAEACAADEQALGAILAEVPISGPEVDHLIDVYEFVIGPPRRPWSDVAVADVDFVRALHTRCCQCAS